MPGGKMEQTVTKFVCYVICSGQYNRRMPKIGGVCVSLPRPAENVCVSMYFYSIFGFEIFQFEIYEFTNMKIEKSKECVDQRILK